MNKTALSLFLLGISFGSGPCLFSCGALLIPYIAGTNKKVTGSILTYTLFSLTRIIAYLLFSLLIFVFGRALIDLGPCYFAGCVHVIGGMFIIFIGAIIILGRIEEHKICEKIQRLFLSKDKKTVIMLGLITGLLPCAPLLSVFSYIGLISKYWPDSLIYGLSFGMGTLFSPLLAAALLAGMFSKVIYNKSGFKRIINIACGSMLVILGVQLVRKAVMNV